MADYDVGALSLSVPPASAVLQSYRPAVLIRNNGVHDALASGTLRIYSPAGLLIFTTEIYSGTIAPGNTEPAQATDYWTPPAIGRYQVIAYVSCPLDQYEPNNSLAPRFVDVTGAPPPPEPTVPLHASQHEEGGSDEVDIDGLRGRAADPQTALAHKTSHQVAGADELDLTGMGGILRDGQPIADHHETHEDGGGDELYVAGLHGELADNQPSLVHDNAKHDPNYTTVTEFNNHMNDTTAVHAVATNLEQVANKGEPDGYPELDENGHVPPAQLAPTDIPPPSLGYLRNDQTWDVPATLAHKTQHQDGGTDEISIAGLSGKAADAQDPVGHHVSHEPGGSDPISGVGAHKTTHEDGGSDELSIQDLAGNPANRGLANGLAPLDDDAKVPVGNLPPLGGAPHAATHDDGGNDEISIAGLSGKAADAQDPTSHGNALHSTSPAEPARLEVLAIGTAGSSSSVARADHSHTGPGAVKTQGGTSFNLWDIPRPEIVIEIGNGLYDTRGLTLESIWRGTSVGYVVGSGEVRDIQMRARLTTAGVTHDLVFTHIALPPTPGHDWFFQFDCIIRGHSQGVSGQGRLSITLDDGSLTGWAQNGTFFSPVPFITANPAELDIAAKMDPYGGEDAGVIISGFELLYTTPTP